VWYDDIMKSHIKQKAIILRNRGYSYKLISERLGIGKGTLSCWLKEIPFKPNEEVLRRIQSGPRKSGMLRHNKRVAETKKIKEEAKKELGDLSKRDLWMLGVGLYIGEGSKSIESVRIMNSDPEIIKASIRWFKNIIGLKDDNIVISIHLYPDSNKEKCLNFWSATTKISRSRFKKTQIDERKNKSAKKQGKLPYGTAHIRIISNGQTDFGVKLHRRIMGWIEGVMEQLNK